MENDALIQGLRSDVDALSERVAVLERMMGAIQEALDLILERLPAGEI